MRVRVVAVVVLNLAVAAWFLLVFRHGTVELRGYHVDLDVYRLGADAFLHGAHLYGRLPDLRYGGNLPFTYPPVAAMLLGPLAVVPFRVASVGLSLLTIGSVAFVLHVVLRRLNVRRARLVWVLLPFALLLEPVRTTLNYGQVNALLMALVVADCLLRPPAGWPGWARWPRGALVGLAAAIKLTPALFVLYFLVRGDRKAALTAGVSFLCWTALGWLFAWHDSTRYWTGTVFHTERIGPLAARANESIMGLLAKSGVESRVLWVLLSVALLALTAAAMRRAFAAGRPVWALCLCALGALPVTPISWCHHWVWCVPVLVCLGLTAWRRGSWPALALAVGGTALFALGPQWWWADTDPWTWPRLLLGNAYPLFAVLVLVLGRRPATQPAAESEAGAGWSTFSGKWHATW